jgi:hypothetical protein
MPAGVPVATMSIGKAGAKNAGVFAAQIIAVSDVKMANRLKVFRVEMEHEVEEKAKRLEAIMAAPAAAAPRAPVVAEAPETAEAAKKKPRRRRRKKKTGGPAPAPGQTA